MPQPPTNRDLRARDATRVSIAKLRTQADAAGPVDAMRLRAAADRLEADLTADEVVALPVFTPTRQALLRVLTMVQNCPRYAEQDIMTFCGFLSTAEVSDHLWANFRNLPEADKARVLAALRAEADAALAEAA